jgi:hypothetical protein
LRKKFLRETARRAKQLEQAIEYVGSIERNAILEIVGSHNLDLNAVKRSVHFLWLGATAGARNIPPSQRGRHGDGPFIELLCKLFRVYLKAFGENAPRLSKTHRYSGRFFSFAEDVLKTFGVRKSNHAIGKAIEKAIAAVDRWNAKNRVSPK